jgi:hypothetical protein
MIETSLQKQKEAIPELIDAAIEKGDVFEIVKANRRGAILDQFIICERLALIQKTIKENEAEKKSVAVELKELEPKLLAAKKDYETILEKLEAAYLFHGKLQLEAWSHDQRAIELTENISQMRAERFQLKTKLRNDGEKQ